jgi:site-specific DNA-methyltransferase (cytosine-N4-specific)
LLRLRLIDYGLRDYGTTKWVGGDPDCKHYVSVDGDPGKTHAGKKQQSNHGSMRIAKSLYPHCGAVQVDQQIGQEQTPDEYVDQLMSVFREVQRTLKDDGTLWLNLADRYYSKRPWH